MSIVHIAGPGEEGGSDLLPEPDAPARQEFGSDPEADTKPNRMASGPQVQPSESHSGD